MNRPFAFFCPSCGRRVEAYEEHCGQELRCPGCADHFIVPRASWAWKSFPDANAVFPRIFSQEELQLLADVDGGTRQHLIGATSQSGWEFQLIAGLLKQRLEPLRQMLTQFNSQETTATRGLFRRKIALAGLFEGVADQFLDACESLYPLLTGAVEPAMYGDNVEYIVDFVNGFEEPVGRLCAGYGQLVRSPVPAEFPHPNLVYVLKDWAYQIWHSLDEYAGRLTALAVTGGPLVEPQVSLAPSSLHEYFRLLAMVPRRED